MMSEAQKVVLKEFLGRPIAYFDVVIDDWKKSIVWQYFGELAFKDPETGTVSVIDNERHYCLKCIVESQERNPEECFEKCNICFLSNGTATGNHKNHLRLRHHIVDDKPAYPNRGMASSGEKAATSTSGSGSGSGSGQKTRKSRSRQQHKSLDAYSNSNSNHTNHHSNHNNLHNNSSAAAAAGVMQQPAAIEANVSVEEDCVP